MSESDPWSILHHEDEPDEAPAPKPRAEPKPKANPKAAGTPMPIGLTMTLPPEVMDVLNEIAESQREIAASLAQLITAITPNNGDQT